MKSPCLVFLILIFLFPVSGAGQQRRRRQTSGRAAHPAASAPANTAATAAEARVAAERVSDQIKNLTRFVYLFGRISNGIETTEQLQAQDGGGNSNGRQPRPDAGLDRTKSGLLDSIRNVRAGLDDLESHFESTPAVRKYYGSVAGVGAAAASAETQAAAGQYDQAGRSLLEAVNKLTDVLLLMR